MKFKVINIKNKEVGEIDLDEMVFAQPMRVDILSRVIRWQMARRRSGNHKTKQIAEISGTGKKAYRQKGTGNARHGSLRAPQFRGGSVIFGPVVRSHEHSLPKKIRRLGLQVALSAKRASQDLVIIDKFDMEQPKTQNLKQIMKSLGINSALLIDVDNTKENVVLAASNLSTFDILPQIGANVYDILKKEKLLLTVDAIKALEARLK